MAGEQVPGVEFGVRQPVEVTGGVRDGARGVVLLLADVTAEPTYLVELADGGVVRMRQSMLRAAS
jgi:hypothetical protein